MKKDQSKNGIKLVWTCYQGSCRHINCRIVEKGCVIFEDYCDACKKLTHEPITKVIKNG